MQKMFVIHYYINKQILDSYLHTKSEKISLLFTFVLNWVFLQFPWQWQAFWNFQALKPFIHMPYNISIKFHPIPSTLNFSRFLWQRRPFWNFGGFLYLAAILYLGYNGNGRHFEFVQPPPKSCHILWWIFLTVDINAQHQNLLGNQISPKSEDFCILVAILDSKWPP